MVAQVYDEIYTKTKLIKMKLAGCECGLSLRQGMEVYR